MTAESRHVDSSPRLGCNGRGDATARLDPERADAASGCSARRSGLGRLAEELDSAVASGDRAGRRRARAVTSRRARRTRHTADLMPARSELHFGLRDDLSRRTQASTLVRRRSPTRGRWHLRRSRDRDPLHPPARELRAHRHRRRRILTRARSSRSLGAGGRRGAGSLSRCGLFDGAGAGCGQYHAGPNPSMPTVGWVTSRDGARNSDTRNCGSSARFFPVACKVVRSSVSSTPSGLK